MISWLFCGVSTSSLELLMLLTFQDYRIGAEPAPRRHSIWGTAGWTIIRSYVGATDRVRSGLKAQTFKIVK
jgi:hypothetical protein